MAKPRLKFRYGDVLGFKCAAYNDEVKEKQELDVCMGFMLDKEEFVTSTNSIRVYYFRACKHHANADNEMGVMHLMAKSHFLIAANEDE